MSAAFTPGPWTADDAVEPWWGGDQPGCMVRFWTDNTGHPVANCLSRDTGILPAVANAKLIAAAPQLYEFIEAMLGSDGFSNTFDRVLAEGLLAKARGEQS